MGFITDGQTVKIDDNRIKSIVEMKRPHNVKGVRTFLGVINFVMSFIGPEAKQHSRALYDLLKKNTIFE